jgi:large subunit ribosomal protein L30
MTAAPNKEIKIRLVRSGIGRPKKQKAIIRGLGLKKMNRIVTLNDTPQIRGMIGKVTHLVEIVEES